MIACQLGETARAPSRIAVFMHCWLMERSVQPFHLMSNIWETRPPGRISESNFTSLRRQVDPTNFVEVAMTRRHYAEQHHNALA